MAYKISVVWTGSLENFVVSLPSEGRVVGVTAIAVKKQLEVAPEPAVSAGERVVGTGGIYLDRLEQTVLNLLKQSDRDYSYSEAMNYAGHSGYKPQSAASTLSRLVKLGLVYRSSRGLYRAY